MMSFIEQIRQAWQANNSLLCVGLDTDNDRLPASVGSGGDALLRFNRAIVDATADLVCAYKPQIAYYAGQAAEDQLSATIAYIHDAHPGIPVILDAKRGDIGSTARMYAREVFDRYGADAVTVNPYMGRDALDPFLERADRGVVILCRTSNPSAGEVQDVAGADGMVFEAVARRAASEWNGNGNVLLVVGATYPGELKRIRSIVGDMPFLVPGIGAQGGDIAAAVTNGRDSRGTGMIINSSRAVLYADSGPDFAQAARRVARETRDEINRHR